MECCSVCGEELNLVGKRIGGHFVEMYYVECKRCGGSTPWFPDLKNAIRFYHREFRSPVAPAEEINDGKQTNWEKYFGTPEKAAETRVKFYHSDTTETCGIEIYNVGIPEATIINVDGYLDWLKSEAE